MKPQSGNNVHAFVRAAGFTFKLVDNTPTVLSIAIKLRGSSSLLCDRRPR